MSIKLFEYFYVTEDVIDDEIVNSILEISNNQVNTTELFGQVFDILKDESEVGKIYKCFYISVKVLKSMYGKLIYENVIGNNYTIFGEYIDSRGNEIEDNSKCNIYTVLTINNELQEILNELRSNTETKELDRPKMSILVRKSIAILQNQLNTGVKITDRKSVINLFKCKLEDIEEETENKFYRNKSKSIIDTETPFNKANNDCLDVLIDNTKQNNNSFIDMITSNNRYSNKQETSNFLDMIVEKPSKTNKTVCFKENTITEDKKQSDFFSPAMRASRVLNSIGNQYSPRKSKLDSLWNKNLLTNYLYTKEEPIEGDKIIHNTQSELTAIDLNLLIEYILNGKVSTNISSTDLIFQHQGFINNKDFLILLISWYDNNPYILDIINHWVIHKYYQIKNDPSLFNHVLSFYNNKNKEIVDLLNNHKDILDYNDWNIVKDYEEPILCPYASSNFNILEWSEIELARQLTIITHHLYRKIDANELINSLWTKVDKLKYAPNVSRLIDRFNKLSSWISEEILAYDSSTIRALIIEKFIRVGLELKEMNNYNDCLTVVIALNSLQIKSLSKTWRKVSFENIKHWKDLNSLCSFERNYGALREEIERNKDKPCIPYLGIFLKELAFIDEGYKYIVNKNLINVEKIKKVSKVIDTLISYKKHTYNFKPVFKLAFLAEPTPLSEDELNDISSKLEPVFTLNKTKKKGKRQTNTDIKINELNDTFLDYINYFNRDKSKEPLKEIIKNYFK